VDTFIEALRDPDKTAPVTQIERPNTLRPTVGPAVTVSIQAFG
jgi:hypothetical protein